MSCDHTQSSDRFAHMVVRHFNFVATRYSYSFRIALFSTALAVQIFGPKERATVTILGAECLIIMLFGVVGFGVTRLFCAGDDVHDVGTPAEKVPPLETSQRDVELGPGTAAS